MDLALRCDVTLLFQELGVDTDALVFVDEFPWKIKSIVEVTLMDHNAVTNKNIPHGYDLQVVEIVDHHSDLGQHLNAQKREIAFADGKALVASTCTLVAEKLFEFDSHDVHKLLATMLLGVIALDSINFDPTAKKVTPRDAKAAKLLEEMAFARKEDLYDWLQNAKFNPGRWQAFSLEETLRVDHKEFTFVAVDGSAKKIGISSVLIDLKAFMLKAEDASALCRGLSSFCNQNELALSLVMTMYMMPDKQCQRQLLFFEEDGIYSKHCVDFITKIGFLEVVPLVLPAVYRDERIVAFDQLNASASRKQVAPIILSALTKVPRRA
ncbi:hypothetical protein CCR75_001953 [Bremia lactucae]|uniref:DHHA2 domain-containing protein n=1 Tax=Bremia lactucae TaxID=4779 RepID=A0A976IDM9_BRELC|nr:hypothetical protein CCR75_001953 [Bremia lactucae]